MTAFLKKYSGKLPFPMPVTFSCWTSPFASLSKLQLSPLLFLSYSVYSFVSFFHGIPHVWNNVSFLFYQFTLKVKIYLKVSQVSLLGVWSRLDVFWELLLMSFLYPLFYLIHLTHLLGADHSYSVCARVHAHTHTHVNINGLCSRKLELYFGAYTKRLNIDIRQQRFLD